MNGRYSHAFIFCVFFLCGCRSASKSDILNVNDWAKNLIGKWEYSMEYNNVRSKFFYEGEVEYLIDSTFVRTVTIKAYEAKYGEVQPIKGFEDIISGGSVKGRWRINSKQKMIIEIGDTCNIANSLLSDESEKDFNACESYRGEIGYGNWQNDYGKGEMIEFSKKTIRTKVNYFVDGGTLTYKAKKME